MSSYDHFVLSDSDSDEEDEEASVLMMVAAYRYTMKPRPTYHVRDRLDWDRHVQELCQEGGVAFVQLYRMDLQAFNKLCDILCPKLFKDERMSRTRTDKATISTEIALHCFLRWAAGGSYLDIRLCAGISITSFYTCIHSCMDALYKSPELAYSFPTTPEEIEQACAGFRSCSSHDLIRGCVACIDGFLLKVRTPSKNKTGNVKAYFSGHYQTYGINVQAACDSRCRFVYCAPIAPGGANDITAFRKTGLSKVIESLPVGTYVIGDNAYVCSEHLLTPFSGCERNEPRKDTYNFFISQMRIRIEMAFGSLTNRWRVLRKPLEVSLKNATKLVVALTVLHNYCINENCNDWFVENIADGHPADGFLPSDTNTANIPGNSILRDYIVDEIASAAVSRPAHNIVRQNRG